MDEHNRLIYGAITDVAHTALAEDGTGRVAYRFLQLGIDSYATPRWIWVEAWQARRIFAAWRRLGVDEIFALEFCH